MLPNTLAKTVVYFAVCIAWGILIVTEFYGPRQAAFWWGIVVVAVILGGWYRYLRYRERQFRELELRNPGLSWVGLAVLIATVVSQIALRFWR